MRPDRRIGRRDMPPRYKDPATQKAREGEEDFSRLLLNRPPVPLSVPREAPLAKVILRQPGEDIVNRRCRIEYRPETGWYLLTLLPGKPGELVQPRWVLPSQWLELVEPHVARQPRQVFEISGEATAYKNRAFIFLHSVALAKPGGQAVSLAKPAEKPKPAEKSKAAPKAEPAPKASVTPEEIIRDLRRARPGTPLAVPADAGEVTPIASVAPAADREQLSEDRGNMRIDRLVGLVMDESSEWWEARFVSDNTLQDQPVRLLPCALLEDAERLTARQRSRTVPLRISGQISQYKGRRYLLLRKVFIEHDLGQF